jgi:hypothetical protein
MVIESLANTLAASSAAAAAGYSAPTLAANAAGSVAISTIGDIQIIPSSTKLLTLQFSFSFTITDD